MMMKKIGIFGGTFNPPHIGHMILADLVFDKLKLDELIFIPAYIPPHKAKIHLIDAKHRLNMLKLSINNKKYFKISDIEIKRGGKSYTYDTLMYLKSKNKNTKFYLIIGYDNYKDFTCWKNYKEILKNCKTIVLKRFLNNETKNKHHVSYCQKKLKDVETELPSKNFIFIDNPILDISSTEIRNRIKKGKSFEFYVTEKVASYIKKNRLYI